MDPVWIVLIILVLAAGFAVLLYNRLVALRQTRRNAFSDIDVQLKQRYNLVPQLLETVKGYAKHEKEVFENVTDARAQVGKAGNTGERVQAEGLLGGALMGLLAVAENYPDLQADQNFRQLMAELSDLENKIAAARRFFNNATAEYNTAIQQFPANLIAGTFGFSEEPFFELDDQLEQAVRTAPEVKFT
ncbi:MAG: LemA family protein [Alphaproteobacteria bacterium]|nr:LemA family protein [Alphaproteobacteria bacterium]